MERGDVAGTKGRGRRRTRVLVALVVLATLYAAGCSNDPYPPEAPGEKVLYGAFEEAPRSLDPATAYDTRAHAITGAVYATLLEYHFLKRPLELMPSLAVAMPEERALADGRARMFSASPGPTLTT